MTAPLSSYSQGQQVDLAIVGGGPCGLTAALEASRKGLSVALFEHSPTLGGMSASFRVAGQMVDYGSHRLHPSMPTRVRRLLTQLLGPDLQVRQRHGRLRLRGRWVDFPLRPTRAAWSLPVSFLASVTKDMALKPLRPQHHQSYADVVTHGLGPTALTEFHGPMAEKLWGVPPTELSSTLAIKRLSVRSPTRLARSVARTARPGGRTFLYPRLGYGQIVDQMAKAACTNGASLTTSVRVRNLTDGLDGCRIELDSGLTVSAKHSFWTGSVDSLAVAMGTPSAVPRRTRAMVLVYLVVPRPQYTKYDAHYVPDLDIVFSRLSEPLNYRDGPEPENQTVLCAEIPCDVDDYVWNASDETVESMVIDGLERLGFQVPTIIQCQTRRLPSVYPLVTINDAHISDHQSLPPFSLRHITVLGRQGLAVADNLHHVVDMAQSAVDCLDLSGRWSTAQWDRHRDRFSRFVVED